MSCHAVWKTCFKNKYIISPRYILQERIENENNKSHHSGDLDTQAIHQMSYIYISRL